MGQGAVDGVLRLLEQFPPGWRAQAPALDFIDGHAPGRAGAFDRMAEAMRRAAAGFESKGESTQRQLALAYEAIALNGAARHAAADALLPGLLAEPLADEALACALHAHVWQALECGPLDDVAPRFQRELDVVERLDTAMAWYQAMPVARYLGLPHMVPALQRYAQGALRHAGAGSSPLHVLAVTVQAFLAAWAGQPDTAETLLRPVEEELRWLGQSRSLQTQTQLCRALLHTLQGETAAALAAVRRPSELLEDEPDGPRRRLVQNVLLLHEARLAAVLGDSALLRQRAEELSRVPQPDTDGPARAQRALLPAYLADAEGQTQRAIALRRAALDGEAQLSRLGLGVETRLRLAAALCSAEGAASAAACLKPALQATDDATELAPVLLAGPATLRTLAHADWGVHLDAAALARLQRWQALALALQRSAPPTPVTVAPASLAELSAREAEVLERIAAGDSNKLIARAFNLSPHTVKRHVANILDKLGVQTRGQAAAWFRARR